MRRQSKVTDSGHSLLQVSDGRRPFFDPIPPTPGRFVVSGADPPDGSRALKLPFLALAAGLLWLQPITCRTSLRDRCPWASAGWCAADQIIPTANRQPGT